MNLQIQGQRCCKGQSLDELLLSNGSDPLGELTGGSRPRRESPRGRAKGCPPKRYLELGNKDWQDRYGM